MVPHSNLATPTAAQPITRDAADDVPLAWAPCFIEHQFPVAKVSMESYKERKANYGQTLTGLGKWWGRKPLVLIRAAILGLLMPASMDPSKDREVFLKLMTMDEEGLWRRKDKAIPQQRLIDELFTLPPSVQKRFLDPDATPQEPRLRRLMREERMELQQLVFSRMPYSEKLEYSCRPEHIDGPSQEAWQDINTHLGTNSSSLPELIEELGRRRFGHRPRVGDSFCGAGSVPFEAARLGCDAYGSDLSPVAALLTWSALNIVGGGEERARQVQEAQNEIFETVDRQVIEWGIEQNELGWRADAYLYCVEVRDPETEWIVPLAPSWVIGEKTKTVARLVPDERRRSYEIEILQGVSEKEMKDARESGTVKGSRLVPPHAKDRSTPIELIRRNIRLWENEDLVPRPEDVFQERLYCIRWVETYYERISGRRVRELTKAEAEALANFRQLLESGELKQKTRRYYRAPTEADIRREDKVLELLRERFREWQDKGYIPSRRVEPGEETARLQRERGWTYWHHLFNPRHLLFIGLLQWVTDYLAKQKETKIMALLRAARCADYSCRLSQWHCHGANEKVEHVFANQALNTLNSFGSRAVLSHSASFLQPTTIERSQLSGTAEPLDARSVNRTSDVWITDPPYADAINYHELSEFFLALYEKQIPRLFPEWYSDSKRALAVKGNDANFRQAMVDCYRRLAECMPENGIQVVMFTHQDAAVWADLTMILWAAGLRVTAAWCIATETESALKQGNYVQGTVLLVCRKRVESEPVFLDEIAHRVEAEVRRQLDSMLALEDESDPNFGDADYQLAAYAAALRVLTERPIHEIDPAREVARDRPGGEIGPVEQLIRNAVKIACDHLVPRGIEPNLWRTLSAMERFYLKGLEVESHGERRSGVYQELARGFGASDYTQLLASSKANETRLKTATEFGRRMLSGDGFAVSLVRQVLFAVSQVVRTEVTSDGLNWLKTELSDYWSQREKVIPLLDYLAALGRISALSNWRRDAEAAALLAGAVRNDHV